ncbi:MAG TPA: alpha/beta hydrolase, partial [Acidimicrobiales bacterium]
RAEHVTVAGESVAVLEVAAQAGEYGPPLLVVHGFPTSSVDFRPVVDRLSERRRVVMLDLPGYGLSDKPDRAYSLFDQADVVVAVAAATGLDEIDLLTHDMGDSVGGEVLARSMEGALDLRVRRRVLTNGSIYLGLAHLTPGQQFLRQLPDEALAEGGGPDAEALTDTLLDLCGPATRSDPAVRARLRAGAELAVRDGGSRLLPRLVRYIDERAQHEDRWTGAVEAHPSPLTVVWGRHDPIAVAAMPERLAERRPDATVVWLEAGHWPMLELPGAFADAVLRGLDRAG